MKLVNLRAPRFYSFLRSERGQVIPIVAVMITALLGMCALAVDVGRAMYFSRDLQAATDAAAIAGAQAITTAASPAAVTTVVNQYSAGTNGYNSRKSLPSVTVTSQLKCFKSLQSVGQACTGAVPYNAVQVQETANVQMYMAGFFGYKTMPIVSVATASARGGAPRPTNVALIVDTTLSMNITDSNCGATQMTCALNGVQQLLLKLSPCPISAAKCADGSGNIAIPFDQVSLFTFPAVSVSTASINTSCTSPMPAPTQSNGYYNQSPYGNFSMLPTTPFSGLPTALPYNFPTPGMAYKGLSGNSGDPTYQITPFLSDYRTSDAAATLNPASLLAKAAGAVAGCGGMAPPNYEGDYETYYAGVIYAAQSALMTQQAAYPGSENVIIILSDGDSNALQSGGEVMSNVGGYPNMTASSPSSGNYKTASSNGTYPSWVNECSQAITAAQAAAGAGTLVYSVAYGAEPSGCKTDTSSTMSPCNTMAGMASAPQYFYSDYLQSNSNSTCVSSQPVTSLSGIFSAIANDLTQARLIPNNTT